MFRYVILISYLFCFSVYGTTFLPLSLKKQINSSDGIVYGEVLEKEFLHNKEFEVVTKVILKVDKWIGVGPTDHLVEVYFPGGTIDNRTVQIEGAPNFEINEKVLIFLGKDDQNILWVKNLGLGKYSEKKVGTSKIFVNQIFPTDPKIGQISSDIFFEYAERLKDQKFFERLKGKYENNKGSLLSNTDKKILNRSIASQKEENNQKDHIVKVLWLLAILILLFVFRKWLQRWIY